MIRIAVVSCAYLFFISVLFGWRHCIAYELQQLYLFQRWQSDKSADACALCSVNTQFTPPARTVAAFSSVAWLNWTMPRTCSDFKFSVGDSLESWRIQSNSHRWCKRDSFVASGRAVWIEHYPTFYFLLSFCSLFDRTVLLKHPRSADGLWPAFALVFIIFLCLTHTDELQNWIHKQNTCITKRVVVL